MPPRYYAVRYTSDYSDVTLHTDRGCPDGPVRAVPNSVDGEPCPECMADAVDDEPETCQTVKADGEICGRTLPCRYHS